MAASPGRTAGRGCAAARPAAHPSARSTAGPGSASPPRVLAGSTTPANGPPTTGRDPSRWGHFKLTRPPNLFPKIAPRRGPHRDSREIVNTGDHLTTVESQTSCSGWDLGRAQRAPKSVLHLCANVPADFRG